MALTAPGLAGAIPWRSVELCPSGFSASTGVTVPSLPSAVITDYLRQLGGDWEWSTGAATAGAYWCPIARNLENFDKGAGYDISFGGGTIAPSAGLSSPRRFRARYLLLSWLVVLTDQVRFLPVRRRRCVVGWVGGRIDSPARRDSLPANDEGSAGQCTTSGNMFVMYSQTRRPQESRILADRTFGWHLSDCFKEYLRTLPLPDVNDCALMSGRSRGAAAGKNSLRDMILLRVRRYLLTSDSVVCCLVLFVYAPAARQVPLSENGKVRVSPRFLLGLRDVYPSPKRAELALVSGPMLGADLCRRFMPRRLAIVCCGALSRAAPRPLTR